jgi:hypothetical protein
MLDYGQDGKADGWIRRPSAGVQNTSVVPGHSANSTSPPHEPEMQEPGTRIKSLWVYLASSASIHT